MQYLCKIESYYYFRVRVPKNITHILKVKEIKKSLHTKTLKAAKVIVKAHSCRLERVFTPEVCRTCLL